MKSKRTKYVGIITKRELQKHWDIQVPFTWCNTLFVACTKDGLVNDWNKALIYHWEELCDRDNVEIVKLNLTPKN